jgi:hypothetical protein
VRPTASYALGPASSSLRRSSRRLKTQGLVVPSPLAISSAFQPWDAEVATSLTIAIPRGEILFQSISRGVVVGDELNTWPFVYAEGSVRVPESPDRSPLLFSDPVGASQPERPAGEGWEPDSARFKAAAELPALDEEELLEILSSIPGKFEAASADDCPDESLGVVNVVQC